MSSTTTAALTVLWLPSFRIAGNGEGWLSLVSECIATIIYTAMLPYADDSEVLWAFMAQMERVCVPSALLFSFIPTDSSTTPSPWWFPDLKPPFHHHLHSLTQGVWPSVVFSPDPQMFYSSFSFTLSLSLYPLPSLFCSSEKQWFMNCNIYHKTVLSHACSYMIHPQVLLGPHHRRMPICLGKEKVKLWAQKTQCDPRNGVSKVQYVHFYPVLWIWLWWKKSNNDKTIALG